MELTTSYQQVKEEKMGYWTDEKGTKLGTLYLRTYAKVNSQSTENNKSSVSMQSRVYNNGLYCWSGNCYNTLMDEKKKNNVRIDFTGLSEVILGTVTREYEHDENGDLSISLTNTFKCFALGSTTYSANVTVELPTINRKDTATGLDFDIGSSTLISITRHNSTFTRTVVATLGTFSETIIEKGTATEVPWTPVASKLYEQIPDDNTGYITLTTTTYNGDTVVGTTTSQLKCRVTNSNPIISSVEITASNPIIVNDLLIRYITIPKFIITANPQNGAKITKYEVTEDNSTALTSSSNVITATEAIKNNSFTIVVTDSRKNYTTIKVASNNFVPYYLRAISSTKLVRTGEGLNKVEATVNGVWYNAKLGTQQNVMALYYRYKVSGGTYSEYKVITDVSQASNFSITTTLADTFESGKVYYIEFKLSDYLGSDLSEVPLSKAIALTDHWNDGTKDYYNINAEIQQRGERVLTEYKTYYNHGSFSENSAWTNFRNLEIGGVYEICIVRNFNSEGAKEYRSILYGILSIPCGYDWNTSKITVRPKLNIIADYNGIDTVNDTRLKILCEGGTAEVDRDKFLQYPNIYIQYMNSSHMEIKHVSIRKI